LALEDQLGNMSIDDRSNNQVTTYYSSCHLKVEQFLEKVELLLFIVVKSTQMLFIFYFFYSLSGPLN